MARSFLTRSLHPSCPSPSSSSIPCCSLSSTTRSSWASLRYSAADEGEDTLNSFTSHTHETRRLIDECARSLLVSSCCRHLHSLHTTSRGSSCPRVCIHLIHARSERHSSTLSSPFHPTSYSSYSSSISSSSCCPSTSTRIRSNTVYSANKEMGSTDESYSRTRYDPEDYYLMETYVASLTESLTQQQFSEQRFLENVDYDDATIGEMHFNAHREHVYHSHREGLSVGQSSSSVSDRTGRPVVERGQEPGTEHAQIRTLFLGRQRE